MIYLVPPSRKIHIQYSTQAALKSSSEFVNSKALGQLSQLGRRGSELTSSRLG